MAAGLVTHPAAIFGTFGFSLFGRLFQDDRHMVFLGVSEVLDFREMAEFQLEMALVLQSLGFQVQVLGLKDGPLLQDLIRLGLDARVCDQICGNQMLQGPQVVILFSELWAGALAANHGGGSRVVWFPFRDRCKGPPQLLTRSALAKADRVLFLRKEEAAPASPSSAKFQVFRPFVDATWFGSS